MTDFNFPLTLKGGMLFQASAEYKVPKTGIYYLYAQLEITPGSSPCGFVIQTLVVPVSLWVVESTITPTESVEKITLYGGAARNLFRGTTVTVRAAGDNCRYNFSPRSSFFGIFFLVE